jgi:hypothetical protein
VWRAKFFACTVSTMLILTFQIFLFQYELLTFNGLGFFITASMVSNKAFDSVTLGTEASFTFLLKSASGVGGGGADGTDVD